jgi:hypothetical protein
MRQHRGMTDLEAVEGAMPEEGKTAAVGADVKVVVGASVSLKVRHNLAVNHLMAAALFARNARAVEQQHRGEPYGPYFEEIRWQVVACVMMAVAAVEAHFNERMKDLSVDNDFLKLIERKGLIERHDYFLWFTDRPRLDNGAAPTQPFADLVELRNALVHFHPEWDDDQELHAKLDRRLTDKFPTSPFLNSNAVFFPMRCMSHGCAAWAVRTAWDFGDAFAEQIGVEPKFRPCRERLATD